MHRWAFIGCCWIALVPATAGAQHELSDARIRAAIQRGVRFLKAQHNADGSWEYPTHDVGITALAALALAENGVPLDDPVLKRAHQFVRTNAPGTVQTYDISLAILFLVRVGDSGDSDLIRELGGRLAAGQLNSGGWTYTCPQAAPAGGPPSLTNDPRNKPARRGVRLNAGFGSGFGDNSNTQFAVLGIWAAGRAGMDVRDTMAALDGRFRRTQSKQGGWSYNARAADTDAMSCAGLMALILAKGHKTLEAQMVNRLPDQEQPEGPGGRPKMDSDEQIDAGIRRVELFANGISPGSSLYFLWSLERVGVALGSARIGRVDWYGRGAAALVDTQHENGSWMGGPSHGRGELTSTSFALLFLRRSNLTQDVPQLVTGRTDSSGDAKMRAGNLEDLIRTVRPAASQGEPRLTKDER
jgi:hypothetical protein